MKKLILAIMIYLMSCGYEDVTTQQTMSLQTTFESVFGWGNMQPRETKTSTTGPGPESINTPVKCFTEALPAGIDYTCRPMGYGSIQMEVTNNNDYSVYLGNRWHGAIY